MIDIRQLRYFVTIVEQGSFSRAAASLHVAQPALSLHVRNMESELGTPLLFRTARGVEPTEAGTILVRHARIILDQLVVAEEEIRGHQQDPSGEVHLGVPGTIAQIVAVPLITAVHTRYPNIKLRIAEAMSGFILEWMREERIDLAVLYNQAEEHGIQTERLLDEDLLFFGPTAGLRDRSTAPKGTDLTFDTIAQLPLILPGRGHGLRDLLTRTADSMKLQLNTVIDVDSYANIKSLVCAGMGYSILPENAIAPEVGEGKLRSWTISGPTITRNIHIANSGNRAMTKAVTVVRELACEILQELARNGDWVGARITGTQRPSTEGSDEPDPADVAANARSQIEERGRATDRRGKIRQAL